MAFCLEFFFFISVTVNGERGGTILRFKSDGACVFLGPQGYRIHSDRPYVCRLYPLARKVDVKGRKKFARIPLEPECRGRQGRDGTVDSFLAGQDVLPFWRFNNPYEIITKKMIRILGRIAAKSKRLGRGG
jgi:Fe-S-cluster containining protein